MQVRRKTREGHQVEIDMCNVRKEYICIMIFSFMLFVSELLSARVD